MMGGFHMYWGNREIRIKSGSSTKTSHILQLILFHSPERVPTEVLTDQIFSDTDLLDPNNNLKASLTLLRKQLLASGLPRCSYISFRDHGYIWTEELRPELDSTLFESAARKALRVSDERAVKPCQECCRLYSGRFLPELQGAKWVDDENDRLTGLFTQVLRRLISLMSEAGRQEELLTYLEKACRLLPDAGWESSLMQCLMDLNRLDEAKKVYIDAVGRLAKDQDVQPSSELTAQYRKLSAQMVQSTGTLREIVDYIREENTPDSAYYCTFPGFVDAARIIKRTLRRAGRPSFLMLCTLVDLNGDPIESNHLEEASRCLEDALSHGMRQSDFFARYNLNQYLVFLQGTELEYCSLVENRINELFHAFSVRGVRLKFEEYTADLKALDALDQAESF